MTCLFAGTLLTACGDTAKYSKLAEELNNSQTHNNKQIEAVGTVEVPDGVFSMDEDEKQPVMMSVSAGGEKIYNIELNYGKGKQNAIYVDVPEGQDDYTEKDLKIYDKNGKEMTRSNVRMKGTVKYTGEKNEYVIQNAVIEQAE